MGSRPRTAAARVRTAIVPSPESSIVGDPVEDEAVVGMVEARRPGWTVEESVERRVETYLLARRVAAMPLWHEESGRDEREAVHRAYLRRYP